MIAQNVPILPEVNSFWKDPVNQKEFRFFLRTRFTEVFSLDRTQIMVLSKIVFPYWENYLKVIAHHSVTDAAILKLKFGWRDELFEQCKHSQTVRIAQVVIETYTSIDLLPEKIVFLVELSKRNTPCHCLIIHESRGRFEISFPENK